MIVPKPCLSFYTTNFIYTFYSSIQTFTFIYKKGLYGWMLEMYKSTHICIFSILSCLLYQTLCAIVHILLSNIFLPTIIYLDVFNKIIFKKNISYGSGWLSVMVMLLPIAVHCCHLVDIDTSTSGEGVSLVNRFAPTLKASQVQNPTNPHHKRLLRLSFILFSYILQSILSLLSLIFTSNVIKFLLFIYSISYLSSTILLISR